MTLNTRMSLLSKYQQPRDKLFLSKSIQTQTIFQLHSLIRIELSQEIQVDPNWEPAQEVSE